MSEPSVPLWPLTAEQLHWRLRLASTAGVYGWRLSGPINLTPPRANPDAAAGLPAAIALENIRIYLFPRLKGARKKKRGIRIPPHEVIELADFFEGRT